MLFQKVSDEMRVICQECRYGVSYRPLFKCCSIFVTLRIQPTSLCQFQEPTIPWRQDTRSQQVLLSKGGQASLAAKTRHQVVRPDHRALDLIFLGRPHDMFPAFNHTPVTHEVRV